MWVVSVSASANPIVLWPFHLSLMKIHRSEASVLVLDHLHRPLLLLLPLPLLPLQVPPLQLLQPQPGQDKVHLDINLKIEEIEVRVTSITGMANAIQEAKVRPVPSPNLWIRVSGTTRFGGEPVCWQLIFVKSILCTCDNSCATNVGSIGNAEEEKVPLGLLLAALFNVNSQLERKDQFWCLVCETFHYILLILTRITIKENLLLSP